MLFLYLDKKLTFVEKKTIMILEEFQEYFWAYVDSSIVTYKDRTVDHVDFCDAVCYDCYRLYEMSDISIDIICKSAENMLYNVARYKPILNS